MNTRALATAVLTSGKLHIARNGQFEKTVAIPELPPAPLPALCELAYHHKINTTWLAPTAELCMPIVTDPGAWLSVPAEYDTFVTTRDFDRPPAPDNLPRYVAIEKGHYRRAGIALTGLDRRWSNNGFHLADIENGVHLLGGITYLERGLGLQLKYSPGYSAIDLMKQLVPAGQALNDPTLAELPRYNEKDIIWYRPFSAAERGAEYVHIFDENSMYLAGGTGAATPYGATAWQQDFEARRPGFWRFSIASTANVNPLFPPAFRRAEWATTDMINESIRLGYDLSIYGGYTFEHSARALKPWSNLLWSTRQLFKEPSEEYPNDICRQIAYQLVKILATRGVGWLGLTGADYTRQWFKQHWKNQVIGLARSRMFLKMRQLYELYGLAPLLCYTDAIGYASADPDYRTAVPDIMKRADGLGGFKYVRTVKITNELRAMFNGQELAAWQIMRALKVEKTALDADGIELDDVA